MLPSVEDVTRCLVLNRRMLVLPCDEVFTVVEHGGLALLGSEVAQHHETSRDRSASKLQPASPYLHHRPRQQAIRCLEKQSHLIQTNTTSMLVIQGPRGQARGSVCTVVETTGRCGVSEIAYTSHPVSGGCWLGGATLRSTSIAASQRRMGIKPRKFSRFLEFLCSVCFTLIPLS